MDIFILIICGLGFLLSGFLLYGSYLNKKRNREEKIAGTYKKPSSAKWFGWSIYAIGIIAIGYWMFHSVHSNTGGLSIFIFLIWTVLGGLPMVQGPKHMKFADSPEKSEVVKVISKASNTGGSDVAIVTTYFVSFEFPDGNRKNFSVNIAQYNTILENEVGLLTYKEHGNDLMFINFQRQA